MLYQIFYIKDSISLRPRDYIKINLTLYNNENKTVSLDFDSNWIISYFPYNTTLAPFEEKTFTIILLPYNYFKFEKPYIKIKYDNETLIIPLEVKVKQYPYIDVTLDYPKKAEAGKLFKIKVCLNSSVNDIYDVYLNIFGKKIKDRIFSNSCKEITINIPYSFKGEVSGKIVIPIVGKEIPISFFVERNDTPVVRKLNNKIEIYNPHPYPIYFEYKLKINKNMLPFYIFKPNPNYIVLNNETYAIYKFMIYPNETKVIKLEYNYPLIFAVTLPLWVALGLIAYLFWKAPKIITNIQLLKIDKEKKKIKVLISITNAGRSKAEAVLKLKYPSFLRVDKIEFVEGKVEENYIEWKLTLEKGEERLIVVTFNYEIEPTEPFKLNLLVKYGKKEERKELEIRI